MKTIPFTQFLRPGGQKKAVTIDVSDEAGAKHEEVAALGCRMTVEELTTGQVSLCIEHAEGDFDCLVVRNGPAVLEAVEKLILRFSKEAFAAWLKEVSGEPDDRASWATPEANQLFPTCDAVGHCPKPTASAAPYHHFYWDAERDVERMDEIHGKGKGHDDPLSAYGAVVCKTCNRRALVLTENENEDFPAI